MKSKIVACLFILSQLFCIAARAQSSSNLPEAPQPQPQVVHHSFVTAPFRDREVLTLGLVQTGALVADGITTNDAIRKGGHEADPLSEAFIGRYPTWGRMAPVGAVEALGAAYLAERMKRSRRFRKIWWLPQALAISDHVGGTAVNIRLLTDGGLNPPAPPPLANTPLVRRSK